MRHLALVICLLPAMACMGQGGTRQERKMRALMARGKPYPAIRIASDMLVDKEPHPEFFALRAEAYNSIAEFAKGERDARLALQAFPDSLQGLLQLAIAEQGLGRLDSAATHLGAVAQRMPTTDVLYRLAQLRRTQGDLTGALSELDRAMRTSGTDTLSSARLHRLRGEVLAAQGDSSASMAELDKAVALAPDDPVNYNSRGFYGHAWYGDHRGAITDYDRAIKLNPNYSYAFNNRGWSLYEMGEKDKGLKDIQKARRRKAHNPYIYRNLGLIALGSGDSTQACVYFRQALDEGFTAQYGTEVEQRMATCCKRSPSQPAQAPVQAPKGTLDRREGKPVPRTNAP